MSEVLVVGSRAYMEAKIAEMDRFDDEQRREGTVYRLQSEPVITLDVGEVTRYARDCPYCERPFMTNDGMQRHIANKHTSHSSTPTKGKSNG